MRSQRSPVVPDVLEVVLTLLGSGRSETCRKSCSAFQPCRRGILAHAQVSAFPGVDGFDPVVQRYYICSVCRMWWVKSHESMKLKFPRGWSTAHLDQTRTKVAITEPQSSHCSGTWILT